MPDTYYSILDIDSTASLEQIRRAYRKLALKYHPDKNKTEEASELFRKTQEAYEILKDPRKRAAYDILINPDPVEKPPEDTPKKGTDLKLSITVSIEDIVQCLTKTIITKRKGPCLECNKTGSQELRRKKCIYCEGTGYQGLSIILGSKKKCIYCEGIGSLPIKPLCPKCSGKGVIQELIRKQVSLSPVSNRIVLEKLGNYVLGCDRPGDLIIDLEIIQSPFFTVNGLNIFGKMKISPSQAILGYDLTIIVFNKTLIIKIPPGVQHGEIIEHKTGGITFNNKTGFFRGTIHIEIPRIITEEEKLLYNKLSQLEKELTWQKTLSL